MILKELLSEQKARYISLHDLLTALTELDGDSYVDAAKVLSRLLQKENELLPSWYIATSSKGYSVIDADNLEQAINYLGEIADTGKVVNEKYYFDRNKMADFLERYGVNVKTVIIQEKVITFESTLAHRVFSPHGAAYHVCGKKIPIMKYGRRKTEWSCEPDMEAEKLAKIIEKAIETGDLKMEVDEDVILGGIKEGFIYEKNLNDWLETFEQYKPQCGISQPTIPLIDSIVFNMILQAIEQFPEKYPEYKKNQLVQGQGNLEIDNDKSVTTWLINTFGLKTRDAVTTAKILKEHFKY